LARFLQARGHAVHVYCNEIRPDLRQEPGVTFHHLPMLRLGRAAKVLSLWWSSRRAAEGGHDAVMGFGRTRGHGVFRCGGGAHAAYLEACRPGWWLSPTQWLERAVDRRAVLGARAVVSPSGRAADDLARCYGLDRGRVRVVHNGVDSERFRPDAQARAEARRALGLGDGPALAFFGTGFRRKGLDVAAEVARRLGWPMFVIGRDAAAAAWRRRFPELIFLGPRADPERWLVAADAMVLPTRYEPYGNVCLEAMACGVPPVTTPQNGVAEVFPVDWLVGEDAEALAAAARRAVEAGQPLRDPCPAAAEAQPRGRAYVEIEATLLEAGLLEEGGV